MRLLLFLGIVCAAPAVFAQDRPAASVEEGTSTGRHRARSMTAEEARPAMESALEWLVTNQNEDGSWGTGVLEGVSELGFSIESFYSWKIAACSLATLALLRAEETPERRRALESGLSWLCTTRETKRGSDWDTDYVWGALYGFVAITEAVEDPRFQSEDWSPLLIETGRRTLATLERTQSPSGGWAYYDDPIYSRRPTWDTSFCTALIMPALLAAQDLGWLQDPAVIARARRYVARCALPNGAYTYDLTMIPRISGGEHINDVKGSLARIQVCNWGLARAGEKKITSERIREGLEAFFRHHRFLEVAFMKPIPHEAYYANSGYFYMFGHYYAAEAIGLLPAEEREGWHARLRPTLVDVQRADGSTSDFLLSSYMVVASTAYLALALDLGMPDAGAPEPR